MTLASKIEKHYLTITTADEPTQVALDMLTAIEQHFVDMRDDEPVDASEGLDPTEIARALRGLSLAIDTVTNMYKRIK